MKIQSFVLPAPFGGFMSAGWGNGYVCLPPEHPCFGMDYDSIHDKHEIDVNGGLTFSSSASDLTNWEIPTGCESYWIVGFDTAHYGDTPDVWPKEAVEKEAERLAKQFEAIS